MLKQESSSPNIEYSYLFFPKSVIMCLFHWKKSFCEFLFKCIIYLYIIIKYKIWIKADIPWQLKVKHKLQ